MKKLFAIILITVLCLGVTACGLISVETYVEANRDELIETVESAMSSSGITCEADVRADGNALIIDINIDGINNLTQSDKDMIQDTYNSNQEGFESSFDLMKEDLSSLESATWNICEEDGDVIAVIETGNK